MAFEVIADLDCDVTFAIGGFNKKLKKDNPTSAEGFYLGSKEVSNPKHPSGKSLLHILQTPEGNAGVWGKTDLDKKLKLIDLGTMVRITFTGMQATKTGEMYKYEVAQDRSQRVNPPTQSLSPQNSEDEGAGGDEDDDGGGPDLTEAPAAPPAQLSAEERKAKMQALLAKKK